VREERVGHVLEEDGLAADEVEGYSVWAVALVSASARLLRWRNGSGMCDGTG
jgi:hypothetical protein